MDKVFFQNDELCGSHPNKFFDLTVAQTRVAVIESIVIGGQTRQVQKIMAFKMVWVEIFWVNPIQVRLKLQMMFCT